MSVKQIALVSIVLALLVPVITHGAALSAETRSLLLILLQKIASFRVVPAPLPAQIAPVSPALTAVHPLRGRSGGEITLIGRGFSASNTVHTIFESRYGVPSQKNGTEIRFVYRYPPVSQSFDEALAILKTWGIAPLPVEESAIQKPLKSPSQEVLIYVENEYGASNVVIFTEELQ